MMESIDKYEVGSGLLTEDEEIYKENILDHYKHPHNSGTIEDYTFMQRESNPLCGDLIELFVKLEDNKVANVAFKGDGCAISQAAISMLTDNIQGKTVEEIKNITKENILEMLGIPIGVVRIKCALLSLKALHGGVRKHELAGN